jgi:3-hydroxyisobutyrate dehydrogenase-like beta-hydroxyacid dehydrogenase
MESPIGFVGVGIMGKGMLKNLVNKLDSGIKFVVWNRGADALNEILENLPVERFHIARDAKEVVSSCKVTFSMLSTMEASVSVVSSS